MAFNSKPLINRNQRFGDGSDPIFGGPMSLSGGGDTFQPRSFPVPDMPAVHDHSKSRRIAGIIGDALGGLAGQPAMYAQQQYKQRQEQQVLERQMQLAQWKAQNPDPTAMQRNYEYLKATNPQLAESYLRAEANPMTLGTDPMTGNARFYPKGGDQGMATGGDMASVTSDDEFNALPSGTQFRDPQGNVRMKP